MLPVLAAVVLPVLITVLVGFIWTRIGYRLDSKELTALIADVATPCLIVSTFLTTRVSFHSLAAVVGAAATAIVLFTGFGALFLWATGLRIRTFLPSIAFPNAGNLGLPLSLYAFGPEGLGYAIAFFSTSSVANYTLGQAIAVGRAATISVVRIVLGGLVGIAVAALFGLTGPMRAVLILQCANPVAIYNYLFAQRWNNQPEEVAGVVILSTLLSLLSIPLLLTWLNAG